MSNPETIRVMLVDDHAVVRSGLGAFLMAYPDMELVGEAASGQEAVARCPRLKPDVVLMDLMMPGMDGAEATRMLRQECPHTQVIVLTSFKEDALVRSALEAGAIGYLLKDVSADQLAAAIRAAKQGNPTLAPEATQALLRATLAPFQLGDDLTPREREVLALLVLGKTNREIGQELYVSNSTVKFHVSSILSKLGAASRTEAVALALQHKLVS